MKSFLKNTLALFFGFAVSLLLLEIFLQIYNPFAARVKGNTILLPAHQHYTYQNTKVPGLDSFIVHNKNSLGFRGEEPPANFDNALTIVAVGGSTTECYYVNEGKDWPNVLKQQLSPQIPNIWINNAGLNGHSTFGHKILLNDHLLKLKPDYILFLVGINDVERDDLVHEDSLTLKSYFYQTRNWKGKIAGFSEVSSTAFNLYYAYKAYTLKVTEPTYSTATDTLTLSTGETHAELKKQEKYLPGYKSRITELVKLCKENNIQPVFITQPTILGSGYDSVTKINYSKVKHLSRNGYVQWLVLEKYNDITREVCRENNIYLVDLAKKMPKKSAYFYDAIHYTNAGAQKVAEIVGAELLPYLQKNL